eukprot:TRINITY_DN999_c0_g1_i13.p1 TRINITY_DN999_c0_g1~~TRINITY_DN999_c0_g1_i13.p1  ORF type:complete len:945 (+),score=193.94 TRINITY_DN999_c0_g1_i13:2164-4998(+)
MQNTEGPSMDAIMLKVEAMECEFDVDLYQYQIDLYLDKSLCYTATFNNTLTLPLDSSNSTLQLVVRSASPQPESRPLGSVGFQVPELLTLERGAERRHWVTLFDDEDDNLYDGDYEENDIDLPRVLLAYQVIEQAWSPERKSSETHAGISFGIKNVWESKKDSEVLVSTPTKIEAEEIKQPERISSPQVEQNLFTLSEQGKERLAQNPLLFSRQAIIKDTIAESSNDNKGSTVEFMETPPEKGDSPLEEEQKNSEEKVHPGSSPRFGTSVDEPSFNTGEKEKKNEEEEEEEKVKKIETEMIDQLDERVKRLKEELHELELDKASILQKHQKEIQNFDAEMAAWLKEKHSLKSKLVSLEYELSLAQETANQKLQEALQLKEFYDNEKVLKEQEHEVKISQLEARIRSLMSNQSNATKKEDLEVNVADSYKKLYKDLEELSKEYENKTRVLHNNLLDAQAKNSEMLKQLEENKITERELNAIIGALRAEKEGMKRELERMREELDKAVQRSKEQTASGIESEKLYRRRLGELIQENVAAKSKAEEYKIMLEQLRFEHKKAVDGMSKKIATLEEEKAIVMEEASLLKDEMAVQSGKLEKMGSQLETERAKTRTQLEEKDNEVELLREKCKNLELEYLNHENLLEESVRKDKSIKSLENLVEEYKRENERLLRKIQRDNHELLREASHTESATTQKMRGFYPQETQSTSKKAPKRERDLLQIQELGENYSKLLKQLEELNAAIKPKTEENESLKRSLAKCRTEIAELKAQANDKEKVRSPAQDLDTVDQMLVQHMNKARCPVTLRKLGQGEYIFGTRKILAKIHNGKLAIRVGGGYLLIEEFLKIYTSHELGKLERAVMEEDEEEDRRNSKLCLTYNKNIETATGIVGEEEEFYQEVPRGGKIQFRSPPRNGKPHGIESAKFTGIGRARDIGAATDRTKKKLSFGFKK